MRVLVIGGTSFIGAAAVRSLVAAGHDVTVLHRGQTEADAPPQVHHIHTGGGSLPLMAFPVAALSPAPDVVLHMLAMTAADAQAILAAFRGHTSRCVIISSQDVYRAFGHVLGIELGPPDPVPLWEDAPLRARLYPYRGDTPRAPEDPARYRDDYDKVLVERAGQLVPDLPVTILRLPAVYGPRDPQHRVYEFLKRMDDGRTAILLDEDYADWRWTRGYVENVGDAIALAVSDARAAGCTYNVGEPGALTTPQWVRAIGRAAGWHGEIVTAPRARLPAHLVADHDTSQPLVVSSARIRAELGYRERVPRDEGIARAVAWARAHPPSMLDMPPYDYAAEDDALATLR